MHRILFAWVFGLALGCDGQAPTRVTDKTDTQGEKWGFIDTNGNWILSPRFDFLGELSEGTAPFSIDDKFGFTNLKGEVVIPAQWDYALPFTEGLAAVKRADRWGFIDHSGEIVVSPRFESAAQFQEGFARVQLEGRFTFITKLGDVLSQQHYDWAGHFSEGLARVMKGRGFGYIDTTGAEVIPCDFGYASSFSEGHAFFLDDREWGIINRKGKILFDRSAFETEEGFRRPGLLTYPPQNSPHPPNPNRLDWTDRTIREGLMVFPWLTKNADRFRSGYADLTGREVLRAVYFDAAPFSEGLACVKMEGGGRYGYIDSKGALVVPCQFTWGDSFHEGRALVGVGDYKCAFIDRSGKIVSPKFRSMLSRFNEGVAPASIGN